MFRLDFSYSYNFWFAIFILSTLMLVLGSGTLQNIAFVSYLRERPFNLKGGGVWFFSKKIFWFPMMLKKIFWFWWRNKKKSDSEFLSYNLMLNSGKKIRALRDKKINILILVLSEKKIRNETKNHNPPPTPPSS